jgi:hypothetical protein
MYAYSGILSALIERGRTGKGKRVDVSMLESMVEWMSYPLYYAFDGAAPPPRAGAAHATIYPYGPFPAGDGKTVMLGLQNEREWVAFCRFVLEQPALATDPRFVSNAARTAAREALRAIIVETVRPADRRAGPVARLSMRRRSPTLRGVNTCRPRSGRTRSCRRATRWRDVPRTPAGPVCRRCCRRGAKSAGGRAHIEARFPRSRAHDALLAEYRLRRRPRSRACASKAAFDASPPRNSIIP